ncbi:MAG: hypothetical protein PHR35_08065 [Kiritimatiellae bacterium]|nr:hypothetical protein [Kiritimatiellia bacterium]
MRGNLKKTGRAVRVRPPMLCVALICAAHAAMAATPANEPVPFNGNNYASVWRSYGEKSLQANVDSRGVLSVKTGRAVLLFGIEGQEKGDFWKTAQAVVPPDAAGFLVTGTNGVGIVVTLKVVVTNDTVSCVYRADAPLSLTGTFPREPEANWFRSLNEKGRDVQGELWGEYQDLRLHDYIEYTFLENRMRIDFGPGMPMVLKPCTPPRPAGYSLLPPTFTLAFAKDSSGYTANFTVQSLAPEKAPLAGPRVAVVTAPFDRSKLEVNPPRDWKPDVDFAPRKGGPAIFKSNEELAFRMAVTEETRKRIAGKPLEVRCVDSLSDAVVETLPLTELGDVSLKPVKQGPFRIELWGAKTKIGATEFAVVGPIAQRKIGPLEKNAFRLREVDRIECATDNGRHEFYCISPDAVSTGETARAGSFIENRARPPEHPNNHEWLAYRVNNLVTDKPHLLVVEYPDVADMAVGVSVLHPLLAPDVPRDKDGRRMITVKGVREYAAKAGLPIEFVESATPGFMAGLGYPISGQRQAMKAVFYPADDWAVLQFDNYNYMTRTPMRISRLVVYEILDDLPMADAPNLANDRLFGHVDEGLDMPLNTFGALGVLRGEVSGGVAQPGKEYKWHYITAERLVKYLRYRGENAWFPIVYRYGGSTWYPSENAFCGRLDIPALYARVFEENGLAMMVSTAYMPGFPLRLQDRYTARDIVEGADSYLQISGYGAGSQNFNLPMRAPNPLHPLVRGEMARWAADAARRYADYPAVKGVMMVASLNIAFSMPAYAGPSLNRPPEGINYDERLFGATYDDYTIGLFEKATGIRIPVEGTPNPRRFAERKAWLLANRKAEWAAFRCQAIADTWGALADAVTNACPRMTFFGCESYFGNATVAYAANTNRPAVMELLRDEGSVVAAAQRPSSGVFSYYFNPMHGSDEMIFWSHLRAEQMPRYNAMNFDPSSRAILEENDRVGAYMGRAFFEMHNRLPPPDRPWYTTKVHTCRYPLPGNRGSMLDYAVILSRSTPLFICHCWCDGVVPLGHDDDYREFTSAYRAIPLGNYRTVFHEEYPGITVRGASVSGKTFFYAVNTDCKTRAVAIKTSGKLTERTAGYPALAVADGACRIELPSYGVRVFELAGGTLDAVSK